MVPLGSATCLLARSFPVSCGNGEVTGRTHILATMTRRKSQKFCRAS